jgi:hypothetical protein
MCVMARCFIFCVGPRVFTYHASNSGLLTPVLLKSAFALCILSVCSIALLPSFNLLSVLDLFSCHPVSGSVGSLQHSSPLPFRLLFEREGAKATGLCWLKCLSVTYAGIFLCRAVSGCCEHVLKGFSTNS